MKVDHYQHGECETVEFVDAVLSALDAPPIDSWAVGNALKYACRAGYKGDWREDALKCADFLSKATRGRFLDDGARDRITRNIGRSVKSSGKQHI